MYLLLLFLEVFWPLLLVSDLEAVTSILVEVRNVEISRATQQLLNGKSHDFLVVFALVYSKINEIAKFLDDIIPRGF